MKKFGLASEYKKLASVLLYKPGPEIGNYPDPAGIQHLRPINYPALRLEVDHIMKTFEDFGIEVVLIDPAPLSGDRWYLYNMIYCRDLLFMTPEGAVLSNMANRTRKEEVLYAERALKVNGVPVIKTISGEGNFEGADALWVKDDLVMVGVGNRTNREAYEQIREALKGMEVECVAVPFCRTETQHLLGAVQIVDSTLALVRYEITGNSVVRLLEDRRLNVIRVPENNEVRTRQAMNIVTISPRNIMMPADCPETKELYRNAGLTISVELEITQLINGAGGLACATGIIARG